MEKLAGLLLLVGLVLINPSVASSQDDSDILEAHSDARREFCNGVADVGSSIFEDLGNGQTVSQIYKVIEIEVSDVNYAYILKLVADIAHQYQEKGETQDNLRIDLLHRCITTSGTMDKAFLPLWLAAVPESHPQYQMNLAVNSMTAEEIQSFGEDGQEGQAAKATMLAALLEMIPHELTAYASREQGSLSGCGTEFVLTGRDFAYRLGEIVVVKGSIQYMLANQGLMIVLKATPYDIESDFETGTTKTRLFDISYAYLITENGNALPNRETTFTCEDGGFCGVIPFEYLDLVGDAMNGNFSIAYTRTNGSTDVEIPVDLKRVENYGEFLTKGLECTTEFLSMMSEEGYGLAEDE